MQLPEKGFYYHFKHNLEDVFDHAYEVIGIGRETETKNSVVIYRPLYQSEFLGTLDVFVRPLAMFTDDIEQDGIMHKRFSKITDPEIIKKLEEKRDEMYR